MKRSKSFGRAFGVMIDHSIKNAEWIKTIEEGKEHIEEQQWIDISTEEVEIPLKKSHK